MYDAYVCLRDLKTQGTDGGSFSEGIWATRTLNHEQADTKDICTLIANGITLPAGTYRCLISCPAERVEYNQARLQNVTDAVTILLSSSARYLSANYIGGRSIIAGRFTIETGKTLQVQHRCTHTITTYGFGRAASLADEIYTIAEFWREIEPE